MLFLRFSCGCRPQKTRLPALKDLEGAKFGPSGALLALLSAAEQ
jgi:hypothetical protein